MEGSAITREDIARLRVERMGKQRWYRPEVHILQLPDGRRAVVKDFLPCPWIVRQIYGRLLTRREARAYERLRGVDGVPRYLGRIDAFAVAVEWIPGTDLGKCPKGSLGPEVFDRLQATVREMHARGVLHLDLRQRRNVLVEDFRYPRVIDYSSGFTVNPRGLLGRLLLRWFAPVDHSGVLKYRRRFVPLSLSEDETRSLDRVERWRKWWPLS